MVELSLQLQQHQQVTQLSRVTHLVQVAVSARTGCMLFRLARIRKVLLMSSLCTLCVFDLDGYALLDLGATPSFVTPYIAVQFNVISETSSEPFSVSTPVGYLVIARRVYTNCPVIVSQKVTSADQVDLEMVDFDVILGMEWLH